MAYAAVISLKQTIERLLNSSPIPVPSPCPETIKSAYEEVESIRYFLASSFSHLGNSNSESANALERQIREAACRLEDALESHVSDQFLSQIETLDVDVMGKKVKDEIDFFTESVRRIGKEYSSHQVSKSLLPEEDDSSRIDGFDGMESKMVGLEDEISEMKNLLIQQLPSERKVVVLAGMPGIGKTALARQVYEDPSISSIFECRLWVRIGVQYQLKGLMLDILSKLDLGADKIHAEESEKVAEYVSTSLQGKRYLIVLDDIWSTQVWNELEKFFPDDKLGSRILLTTRLQEIALDARGHIVLKRFLDNEKSWSLLCQKVFSGEHSCPTDLEEAGKEIAEKCEGLPLAIMVVGKHLSEADKNPEYWKKVAKDEISAIISADEVMSKKLMLSYKHLPQHLKACFVYMGVFPHGYEIPATKLINLWCAEGFLEPNSIITIEEVAMDCLVQLVSKSVVLFSKPGIITGIKTCKVHSVFLYLCIKEAEKDKFFRVINNYANAVKEGVESQRRLCVHNNGLLGIKDVYNSMASVLKARSLLCTGPHHQYPVPRRLCFSLLRVLDALTIRFHEFPIEVVKLVQLRYLAFTYNKELPTSISKLLNLQYLIVHQFLSIISPGAHRSYLPMEIWNMRELRHLEVMRSDLPIPSSEDALFPNLSTLSGISTRSCTKEVLKRIPNLKKLRIQIEEAPGAAESLCSLDVDQGIKWFGFQRGIKSLGFVIINPVPKPQIAAPIKSLPSGLRKLSLSGLGCPWKDARVIGKLWHLEVLKLKNYAFQGPEWITDSFQFKSLKVFLLEDTDLRHWRKGEGSFISIRHLIIRHCYKLEEIPLEIGIYPALERVELVDVKPSVVASADKILQLRTQNNMGNIQVSIHFSWENQKLKS
ncbi:putative late blight resistance protein homolog R1A-10 [Sesamum indicum]|uniref:Late blight resistance protein homolog R1A-10 n=1 Tax=Sesamum indicum TaxID=4182 RepID=A0A6I9UL80_SESIN|nr:putative late blight resistance protein homolog R1A-10 [Sesamum indicum]XP_011101279.1 putative late blight resistance protein homolog R1A-10 [Sesamum indicum]XP_011101280.1 putative late blight resistance protein homolog R1A-10 [Sesamum indicum]XP_011101281.1 putative late blight resistance protein homolog R1A-10 [Sesamum indicum]XP_020546972.1 putative late blight resistance protein homolog R1A-10 [Sesamum indicum]